MCTTGANNVVVDVVVVVVVIAVVVAGGADGGVGGGVGGVHVSEVVVVIVLHLSLKKLWFSKETPAPLEPPDTVFLGRWPRPWTAQIWFSLGSGRPRRPPGSGF